MEEQVGIFSQDNEITALLLLGTSLNSQRLIIFFATHPPQVQIDAIISEVW